MMRFARLFKVHLLLLIALSCWQEIATAEIYKYKDKNGRWQFTDKPPGEKKNARVVSTKPRSSGTLVDYEDTLIKKYNPSGPVETATLAVMTVKSVMGSGSGFFISNDCYLVTNKHVVRPTETKQWKRSEGDFEDDKEKIKQAKKDIKEEKERLKINKRKLKDWSIYLDELRPGSEKIEEAKEYQFRLKKYERDLEDLKKKVSDTKKQERDFREKRIDFSMNSSISDVTNSFEVTFKDNTKTRAELIEIAADEDLALLKIKRCKAPFLPLNASLEPHQGTKIFAIGSPLGQKDHVTAGIVTNIGEDGITTDAQILPGNSGGPLITTEGEVIGVNTLKFTAGDANAEGFGIAIPSSTVLKSFGKYIQ